MADGYLDETNNWVSAIRELVPTDPVEGGHSGAPFGGIGVSNEQAQQLANRTLWLKTQLSTLEQSLFAAATFVTIQSFVSMPFGVNILKIPVTAAGGTYTIGIQWGVVNIGGSIDVSQPTFTINVALPVAFTGGYGGALGGSTARAFWATATPLVLTTGTLPFATTISWVP